MDPVIMLLQHRENIAQYLVDDYLSWINFHMINRDTWLNRDLGTYYEFKTQTQALARKLSKWVLNAYQHYAICIIESGDSEWLQYFLEYHRNKIAGTEYSYLIIYCGDRGLTSLRNQLMDFDISITAKAEEFYSNSKQYWVSRRDSDPSLFHNKLKEEITRLEKLSKTKYTFPYTRFLCKLTSIPILPTANRSNFTEDELLMKLRTLSELKEYIK